MQLVGERYTVRVDKVPTQEEYEDTLEVERDLNKMIGKPNDSNKEVYDDLISLINTSSSVGNVAL